MEIFAFTLDVIGKILIAYTALAVHGRVRTEQKIDASVFKAMRWEKVIGISGIIFIILGYLIHVSIRF
ncbi:MAG: hypothetical protein NUV53_04450 [Patescibacteria group bacterium]|nr:hypothetical protein [Patescibacteria group bacterium]